MTAKLEIEICMGSSCFLRGNKENLELINDYIKTKDISASVNLKGALCHGQCSAGPIIRINGDTYTNVDAPSVVDILKQNMEQ